MDYYKTLGVSKSASDQDIKTAFRKKAMEYHPDKNLGDEKAEDMFKQINNAYSVLSDPQKRRMYDMGVDPDQNRGPGGFGGPGGRNHFEDLFSHFNTGFGGPGGHKSFRPKVINTVIKINLYESVFGAEKNIKFNYKSPCDVCSGSGAKEFRTCEACNGSGMRTMQHGPHSNVMMTCNACGGSGKIMKEKCDKCGGTGLGEVKTIAHIISIRPGTISGESIIMHGGGIPDGRGGFGHLVVNIEVEFPSASSFSNEDKEILRKLLN